MDSRDVWKNVEKELLKNAKESCKQDLLRKDEGDNTAPSSDGTSSTSDVKELVITNLSYKGKVSYAIVYVPMHIIRFTHLGKPYTFIVHGHTGTTPHTLYPPLLTCYIQARHMETGHTGLAIFWGAPLVRSSPFLV